MKKLVISALCGLCLFGAMVAAAADANSSENAVEVAGWRCAVGITA